MLAWRPAHGRKDRQRRLGRPAAIHIGRHETVASSIRERFARPSAGPYGDVLLLQAPSDERRAHQAAPSAHAMPNCRPDERRATVARPSPDASQGCHPASIGERLFAHVVPRPTERFASWMTAGHRWERRRTLTPMNHWQPTAPGDTDRIKSCRQAVTGGLVSLGVCMITASRSLCSNTAYRWVIRIEDHPAIWQS